MEQTKKVLIELRIGGKFQEIIDSVLNNYLLKRFDDFEEESNFYMKVDSVKEYKQPKDYNLVEIFNNMMEDYATSLTDVNISESKQRELGEIYEKHLKIVENLK